LINGLCAGASTAINGIVAKITIQSLPGRRALFEGMIITICSSLEKLAALPSGNKNLDTCPNN
jgi:hypothetical protein